MITRGNIWTFVITRTAPLTTVITRSNIWSFVVTQTVIETPTDWILSSGYWDDGGYWDDTATWID